MAEIQMPPWRAAVSNFLITTLAGSALMALHRLYDIGQPIAEMIVDAIGIAVIFTLVMYAIDKGRASDTQS